MASLSYDDDNRFPELLTNSFFALASTMPNRILQIDIRDRLTDPRQPEIWVRVVPEHRNASTEIRGRLMGPRCRYASTVEVAYPLRPFPRPIDDTPPELSRRAVIPEASLWEPTSPFLYEGPLELWDGDELCEQVVLRHGLRYLSASNRGIRLNGKLLDLRGVACNECSDAEMSRLREEGNNVLLADVALSAASLWDTADEVGFLVMGRVNAKLEAIEQAVARRRHPSNLGWLVDAEIWEQPALRQAAAPLLTRTAGELIGIEIRGPLPKTWPAEVQFIVTARDLNGSAPPDLPKIRI
jgi:hypothetical protein